ncbi:MAG: LppX_LprAFG lipoprotein [Anaerolineae bacterium]|nr:LppX_LprAFG lipoprotein [Anaerolineae bacterium]
MPRFLLVFLVAALLLLAACGNASDATPAPADPLALVSEAAAAIRGADTFRMIVDQSGPAYLIDTDFGSVAFRRADARYAAPGALQASLAVLAFGARLDVDVFAQGADQWFRAPLWTGDQWLKATFAPGFNPEVLIAQDGGFQAAVDAARDLTVVGETQLESGQNVIHIQGRADGPALDGLLAGLIAMQGEVVVDVFIDRDTQFPARFVLTETVAGEDEPRIWTLDILDINAPVQLDNPEATPEAAS